MLSYYGPFLTTTLLPNTIILQCTHCSSVAYLRVKIIYKKCPFQFVYVRNIIIMLLNCNNVIVWRVLSFLVCSQRLFPDTLLSVALLTIFTE